MAIWLDAHPATCQIGPTAQSSNHVVELYAQHHLQVYNPINFFKATPPTTRGEHQLCGSPSPYLEVLWQSDPHCSAWIFSILIFRGGGHKGPKLLYYPISSHASPSHVIYHQGGHSFLFHHKPLGLLTSFSGTHLSILCVYHIFPFS
jgi:hypothetical protein